MKRPVIGVALGSGGARGFAHIGVLQVLEEEGIPIDCLAGSSMGSVVAAFYAAGVDPTMLAKLAVQLKRKYWLDFTVPKMGFIVGDKIREIVRLLTKQSNIEDLKVPLAIVATDLQRRERVVFRHGPVDQAVRASISIPGIFVPFIWNGRLLVDGGVIDRVPISVVRDMGADLVIGVDVNMTDKQVVCSSIFDVITQTIEVMEVEIFKTRLREADVLVQPEVGEFSATAFTDIDKMIEAGRIAAKQAIVKIKQVAEIGG